MPLPNLVIAGVPKGGTSSIFTWLCDHPAVQGSFEKETCFFADPGSHVFRPDCHAGLGLKAYEALFPRPNADTKVICEATPSYIYSATALEALPALPSAPKCLFVLREPASQIRSLFTYFQNNWDYIPREMSFAQYLDAVRTGQERFKGNELAQHALDYADYRPWLERWRAALGPNRMKVITFEQLLADPRATMADIAMWCDIAPGFFDTYGFAAENESYAPKSHALQRLNIMMRGMLPKGRFYDLARSAYRAVNTRKPERPSDDATFAALRAEFHERNAELARAFDLDLSHWAPSE